MKFKFECVGLIIRIGIIAVAIRFRVANSRIRLRGVSVSPVGLSSAANVAVNRRLAREYETLYL